MSIVMTFRIALKALNRNKLRTALTMLGMIIGVGAVITMVALGNGAQVSIEQQIQSAGTNVIMVNAGNFSSGGVRQGQGMSNTLTPDDASAIRELPGVQYLVETVRNRGGQVVYGNQNWNTSVEGTNVDLPQISRNMPLTSLAWDGAAYFRMMGRNMEKWNRPWRLEDDGRHMVSDRYNYYYSESELENLLYHIRKVNANGNTVYVVFHNDPEANSLINGFQLRHLVRHKHRVLVPENLVHSHPELKLISAEVNVRHPLFAEVEV